MSDDTKDYKALWEQLSDYLKSQDDRSAQDVRHGAICEIMTKMEELECKQAFKLQLA